MNITQKKIAKTILKKLNKTSNREMILYSIRTIFKFIEGELLNNKAIYVENFGTLSVFELKSRNSRSLDGKLRKTKPIKLIKFDPHNVFQQMINNKKDYFKNKIK